MPDKFALNQDIRISVRNIIFREVISNTLIHREYTNPFPAKLIIEKHAVITENANRPSGRGPLTPENFSPYPKNPVVARVFKEIGRADELGSGFRNISKYYTHYSSIKPILQDADIFKCIIHVDGDKYDPSKFVSSQTGSQTGSQTMSSTVLPATREKVLNLIRENPKISRREIAKQLNISPAAVQKHIEKLKTQQIITRIGPDFGGYWNINV